MYPPRLDGVPLQRAYFTLHRRPSNDYLLIVGVALQEAVVLGLPERLVCGATFKFEMDAVMTFPVCRVEEALVTGESPSQVQGYQAHMGEEFMVDASVGERVEVPSHIIEGLKEIERRRNQTRWLIAGTVGLILLVLQDRDRALTWLVLFVAFLFAAGLRLRSARCPRCSKPFFPWGWPSALAWNCANCGLPEFDRLLPWADFQLVSTRSNELGAFRAPGKA